MQQKKKREKSKNGFFSECLKKNKLPEALLTELMNEL